MSLSEKSFDRQFPLRISAPSGKTLLAMIVVAFFVLHVLAITILVSAHRSGGAEPQEPAALSSGD